MWIIDFMESYFQHFVLKKIGGGGRIRTAEPGGSGFTVRRV